MTMHQSNLGFLASSKVIVFGRVYPFGLLKVSNLLLVISSSEMARDNVYYQRATLQFTVAHKHFGMSR